MKLSMDGILKDLYKAAPELRDKEEELKKVIRELLASKPSAEMDTAFEKKLKAELLERFADKQKKKAFVFWNWFSRGMMIRAAGGVCVAALLVVSVWNYQRFLPTKSIVEPIDRVENKEVEILPQKTPSIEGRKTKSEQSPNNYSMAEKKDLFAGNESPKEIPAGPARDEEISVRALSKSVAAAPQMQQMQTRDFNTEGYDRVVENSYKKTIREPLSTLSIDVDTASYANVRRFINEGSMPVLDAVRIEEMINYFHYDYTEPANDAPLAFNTELSACPWNKKHQLLRFGVQGKRIKMDNLPPNNLVFLIDVSGSMQDANKLPLIKEALKLLIRQMRPEDRIAITVYAGAAGVVLPSTSGREQKKILQALDNLEAGGSTAGSEGIVLAYETAKKYFQAKGNNRVILATDGDFNVGPSSDAELERLIEEKRKEGVFLTVLGFGMGNYKDSKMQKLADKGNGNYAYIDSLFEAKKVLVNQMQGTLFTIAKDVKIQIEFNPAVVEEYRLIGYEKRVMEAQDFDNDKKDAGELGAGHSVTVLYELALADRKNSTPSTNELKYQQTVVKTGAYASQEILTVKFRYKKPNEDKSRLLVYPIEFKQLELNNTSENFRFAAAVAEWGLLLRNSENKGSANYQQVLDLANGAKGADLEGYRAEFIQLVKQSKELSKGK
jgi:Ca-activated chloride channel family protein